MKVQTNQYLPVLQNGFCPPRLIRRHAGPDYYLAVQHKLV